MALIRHTREESGLVLDAELRWWHDGEPIEHPHIIEAFNRGLRVTEDGRYELHFGGDWCFVTVSDCAFAVVAVDASPEEHRLSLRLSDRTAEWLDPLTLALGADGILTARVKDGRARARFKREAQFELGARLRQEGTTVVLDVDGTSWPTALPASSLAQHDEEEPGRTEGTGPEPTAAPDSRHR